MIVHQAKLQNKQAFLFRLVDIANELFAMAASVSRAQALREAGHPEAENAAELADLFCRGSPAPDRPAVPATCGATTTSASTRSRSRCSTASTPGWRRGSLGLDRPARELKPATPFKTDDPKPISPTPKARPVGTH